MSNLFFLSFALSLLLHSLVGSFFPYVLKTEITEDASNRSGIDGSSASKESVESPKGSRVPQSTASKRVENFQLKGKNTFAVPRNVRPLGWTSNKPETREEGDEKPKSNDEFRKMFMKT